MSSVITKKKDKRQVNEKMCNLERDCIKRRLGSQGTS